MKKTKIFNHIASIMMIMTVLLTGLLGLSQHVDARIMNVEKQGSLTVHKYLNPNIKPLENGGAGFQGNGTIENGSDNKGKPNSGPIPESKENEGLNGLTKPLPGAEFSVYGRLTTAEVNSLMVEGSQKPTSEAGGKYDPADPKPLDTMKVKKFIDGRKADYFGTTDANGQITWSGIPINTVDLADNMYLVVETKTPTSGPDGEPIVQQPSMPVIVNIPSTNPAMDENGKEVNNYNYDVNLYMKNYNQTEPGIEKEIDKPIHSVGEEVKYRLTISPLAFDMNEYKELVVTDKLAPELNFLQLGHNGGAAYLPLDQGNSLESNKPAISPEASVVFFRGSGEGDKVTLIPGADYYVSHPAKNTNGTIRWYFTQEGMKKLSGIKAGDGSRIELYFTAVTNEQAKVNVSVPNDATLDFQNKWGYGTKPGNNPDNPNPPGPLEPGKPPFDPQPPLPGNPDPKQPTQTKPTEVVNTIWGERWFEKRDKQDNTIKLNGAEFLVRNRSTRPVTALNGQGVMKTYAPGTTLYAIISNNTNKPNYPLSLDPNEAPNKVTPWIKDNQYVVGWTPDWKEAYNNHWTITSSKDQNGKDLGQFHVQGLEYTNPVHFKKMYIFAEMAIMEENGTNVEVVKEYHYELAKTRKDNPSDADIEKEINGILAQHPGTVGGDKAGDGAWKFYKESEADPRLFPELRAPGANVDYLGKEEWNDYELIEVRAPEGYAPVEKDIEKAAATPEGTTESGEYTPQDSYKDVFEHPFGFKVPGETDKGLPNYDQPTYNNEAKEDGNNVVPVPNAKLPKIPLTGGMGTIIFLVIGLALLITAFIVRRVKLKNA